MTSGVRLQRAAQAAALRAQGLTQQEVADRLGISRTYTSSLLTDPDGNKNKKRKQQYGGTCVDCGAPTNGYNGPAKAGTRCAGCAATLQHESRHWTREACVEALQRFQREYGRPPVASEILHSRPGLWFPNVASVAREFGSWKAGLEAAGMTALPRGHNRNERNSMTARTYVILTQNGDGGYRPQTDTVEAVNQDKALATWLAEHPEDVVAVAISESAWRPRRARIVMKPVVEYEPA